MVSDPKKRFLSPLKVGCLDEAVKYWLGCVKENEETILREQVKYKTPMTHVTRKRIPL